MTERVNPLGINAVQDPDGYKLYTFHELVQPPMIALSPAAQTVLDAFLAEWPDEALKQDRRCLAAAVRTAADQVVPEQAEPVGDSHDEARHDQWMRIRYRFLAIADELEGQ
jgi:hypothetical protein